VLYRVVSCFGFSLNRLEPIAPVCGTLTFDFQPVSRGFGLRVLIINTDYPAFLKQHYNRHPALAEGSFDVQMAARNASFFGVFDAYSKGFKANGHDAWEVHANNGLLQRRYMTERGRQPDPAKTAPGRLETVARGVIRRLLPLKAGTADVLRSPFDISPWHLPDILLAQVRDYQPDVILNQSVSEIRSDLLLQMKPYTKLIVGQIASPMPEYEDYRAYDLMISSLPNFVAYYRKLGISAELNRLAFDRRVLSVVGTPARDTDVSFIGSLSPAHPERARLVEWLAGQTDLDIWGNGIDKFPAVSAINRRYHGEVWGLDMFMALARSKITVNNHIGIAEDHANNMRLYEATGSGCLLLTDYKSDIAEMFEPGREIVCYESAEECLELIRYYSKNETERVRIAAAGQQRTLTYHSYVSRTAELLDLFQSHVARTN
jgi:spore maturation protein CgeB